MRHKKMMGAPVWRPRCAETAKSRIVAIASITRTGDGSFRFHRSSQSDIVKQKPPLAVFAFLGGPMPDFLRPIHHEGMGHARPGKSAWFSSEPEAQGECREKTISRKQLHYGFSRNIINMKVVFVFCILGRRSDDLLPPSLGQTIATIVRRRKAG